MEMNDVVGNNMVKRMGLVLLMFMIIGSTCFASNRYMWLTSSDTVTYSFDTYTFQVTKDNSYFYFHVWEKKDFIEQGVQNEIARREKYHLSTEGWENLSYSLTDKTYAISRYPGSKRLSNKFSRIIFYDSNGVVLDDIAITPRWKSVVPGTIGETICLKLLEYAANKGKAISYN